MKILLLLPLATLFLTTGSFAGERTIKTRDGKVLAKAEITEVRTAAVKITYDGGVTIVALENLPADVQKELGYKSLADRQIEEETGAQEKQLTDTVQSQGRDDALRIAKEKRLREAFLAGKPATQAEADAYFGLPSEALREKLGEPVRTERAVHPGGGSTTLFYDERKATRTLFVVMDGESKVSSGYFKGLLIQRR